MTVPCFTATGVGAFGRDDFHAGSDALDFGARMNTISIGEAASFVNEFAFADRAVNLASVGVAADPISRAPEAGLPWIFYFAASRMALRHKCRRSA